MLSQNSLWGTQESHKEPHNSWCSSHSLNQVPLNTSQLHYCLTHLIKFTNIIHVVTSLILRVKQKKKKKYIQKSKYYNVTSGCLHWCTAQPDPKQGMEISILLLISWFTQYFKRWNEQSLSLLQYCNGVRWPSYQWHHYLKSVLLPPLWTTLWDI